MNKYQEALEEIENVLIDCGRTKDLSGETILKEQNELNLLQELVDKTTPKKVKKATKKDYMETGYKNRCPLCGNMVGTITNDLNIEHDDYCCSCGQALDWSVENEC